MLPNQETTGGAVNAARLPRWLSSSLSTAGCSTAAPSARYSALIRSVAVVADLDRDAARARCEVATEGPWTVEQRGGDWEVLGPPFDDGYERGIPAHVDDAEFIAHARTDLPAALEALDAAEKERDALRERLNKSVERFGRLTDENERLRQQVEAIDALHPLGDWHGEPMCRGCGRGPCAVRDVLGWSSHG